MPKTACLIVDMLQAYDFEDADRVAANVERMIEPLRSVIDWAEDDDDVLLMYVNDSHGDWRSDRAKLVERALSGRRPELIEPIAPGDDVLLVPKARHSVFYQTPLDYILDQEGIERLVLAGQVTEQCILYSALDAHLRHRPVTVVRDAVAHIYDDLASAALKMMERNMQAEVVEAARIRS